MSRVEDPGSVPDGCSERLPARFFLLDVARALAAFSVLIWHYKHFSYPIGTRAIEDGTAARPLESLLWLFYEYGEHAVPFFWMISGFVFARVYLFGPSTGTRQFVVNRFARLYPLHFVTLIAVAILQWLAGLRYGTSLVFGNNDWYHFALNLFFASEWGLERGFSFNAPIWSVSVEVIVYALFWLMLAPLKQRGRQIPWLVAFAFLGLAMLVPSGLILRCGFFFFLGVALLGAYASHGKRAGAAAIAGTACLGAGILGMQLGFFKDAEILLLAAVFSGCILLLLEAEAFVTARMHRLCSAIGDLTYGTYLWHFPIQLVIVLALGEGVLELARNPLFLLFYLAGTVAIARMGFVAIERPLFRRCRTWGRPARSAARPMGIAAP